MREQPFPGREHPSSAPSEMYFNPLPGAAASWNVKNDPSHTHMQPVLPLWRLRIVKSVQSSGFLSIYLH